MEIETKRQVFPSDEWAKDTCKVGQGKDCCRYLTMSARGWSCAKRSSLKKYLDMRVALNTIVAQGDNCDGMDSR